MRDSRRRRMMLRDDAECEPLADEVTGELPVEPTSSQPTYTAGAKIENQPKLIDFVPTRAFFFVGIFLMLVAVVAMLNIAHFKILPFAKANGIQAAELELSLDQGLLSWVASFLLMATAFFCFQVFQVRRFRADDFSGSYRVWIWLAFGFMIASVDATAKISPVLAKLIAANWESGLLAVDRNVWLMIVGVPAIIVCFRLVIEIWRSRIAIGSIAVAVLAYGVANVIRINLLPVAEVEQSVVEANSVVVAHSLLFFSIVAYARFVLLESQGRIVIRQAESVGQNAKSKQKRKPSPVSSESANGKAKSESSSDQKSSEKSKSPATRTASRKSKASKSVADKAAEEAQQNDLSEAEIDTNEADTPTLKLMGQNVQSQKPSRKKKSSRQNRKRAA